VHGRRGRCPTWTTHINAISARKAASSRASSSSQWTDRCYIHCRAEVPIGLCDRCGWEYWNQEAEAIIEEAVQREYEKLPRSVAKPTATGARS
jgi:hypothetical protein